MTLNMKILQDLMRIKSLLRHENDNLYFTYSRMLYIIWKIRLDEEVPLHYANKPSVNLKYPLPEINALSWSSQYLVVS